MEAKKPTVLLDVDGVLGDFLTPALEIVRKHFPHLDADPAKQHCWDLCEWLSLSKEQENTLYDEIKTKGFHERILPYPQAVEAVRELQEYAEVVALTSPMFGRHWCYERWHWLDKKFNIAFKQVIHTHQKSLVCGDLFVDDKASNIHRWAEKWPTGRAFLWLQQYNLVDAGGDLPSNVTPTAAWDMVIDYARTLAGAHQVDPEILNNAAGHVLRAVETGKVL